MQVNKSNNILIQPIEKIHAATITNQFLKMSDHFPAAVVILQSINQR